MIDLKVDQTLEEVEAMMNRFAGMSRSRVLSQRIHLQPKKVASIVSILMASRPNLESVVHLRSRAIGKPFELNIRLMVPRRICADAAGSFFVVAGVLENTTKSLGKHVSGRSTAAVFSLGAMVPILCIAARRIACILVAIIVFAACDYATGLRPAMSSQKSTPVSFFMDQLPSDLSTLPEGASNVVIARVKLLERPVFLGDRDQSGMRPGGSAKDDFLGSRFQVLDVIRGEAVVGAVLAVRFGSGRSRIAMPVTPQQLDKRYFVVLYADKGGMRHLAGFPIDETQFQEWQHESLRYEDSRIPRKE